jgi:hypothetical protein
MKIKVLNQNEVTGYKEYAILHQKFSGQQALASGQSYTLSHTGVGEGIVIFYTGSIQITSLVIDGNTVVSTAIPVNVDPLVLPIEWGQSISLRITATANATISAVYMGT